MKVTLNAEIESKDSFDFSVRILAKQVARAVLAHEKCPYDCEISLTLVEDDAIREINRQFREIDAVTDVLSFPNLEFETPGEFPEDLEGCDFADSIDPDTGNLVLGDIVLNTRRVISQAQEYGHSQKREFAFLIAHSMFHLCGYDHMTEEEAKVMFGAQDEVLTSMGITRED